MSFSSYAEYRDSEVDWVGEIPAAWDVAKFRHIFRESGEKIDEGVVGPMLSVSGYRGIEVKDYEDDNQRRSDEDLVGYRIVRPGQLVVNTMWLNYAGLGVSEHEGHVSPAYRSYWIEADVDPRFIHHLMRSSIYVQGYTQFLTGIRPNSLQMSRDNLMGFPVLLPPRQDQQAIASFLDRETAKIDALVAEQKRLIALLKEKRQAVISHAVTKGLDPNAPMKDSGIEWLGEIPAHWDAVPVKRIARVLPGYAFPAEKFSQDQNDWALLRGINISPHGLRWNEDTAYWRRDDEDRLSAWELAVGDLVLGMDRPWIGDGIRAAVISDDDLPCLLLQRVASIRPHGSLPSKFLLRCFQHDAFFHYCAPDLTGVSVPHLSGGQIEDFKVALPPPDEARAISDAIDNHLNEIDALEGQSRDAIELLRERRAALISAAVTGNIDVRGLVEQYELEVA